MTGEKPENYTTYKSVSEKGPEGAKRDRSTIDFPYLPLEQAMEVADAIYARCGHGSCDIDELAAQMGQTVSGAFRQKTAAAKMFDLVAKDGRSSFQLSDLGKRAVQDLYKQGALADAFLRVPLYQSVYEKYRGHTLPPAKALEREMEALGVAAKQTDRARQAFERSATYSGFFDAGKDRLVRPRLETPQPPQSESTHNNIPGTTPRDSEEFPASLNSGGLDGTGAAGSLPPDVDPIIAGLIARLPKSGSTWAKEERNLWLDILKSSFDLVYKDAPKTADPTTSHSSEMGGADR